MRLYNNLYIRIIVSLTLSGFIYYFWNGFCRMHHLEKDGEDKGISAILAL